MMPSACSRSETGSAPVSASADHGSQTCGSSNGPRTSQPKFLASSIVEPVTAIPTPKATIPSTRTTGIVSGCFTRRTATSIRIANPIAGSHFTSTSPGVRSASGSRDDDSPTATPMPPRIRSHPAPVRNAPTIGYGTNRSRFPRRRRPSSRHPRPVSAVTAIVVRTTVRKLCSGPPNAPRAVFVATTPRTDAAAASSPPITPRRPARHAKIASVTPAPTPKIATPSAMELPTSPLKTNAARAIARIVWTAPTTTPPTRAPSHPAVRDRSDTFPLSVRRWTLCRAFRASIAEGA